MSVQILDAIKSDKKVIRILVDKKELERWVYFLKENNIKFKHNLREIGGFNEYIRE
jgi:hypothetical protein